MKQTSNVFSEKNLTRAGLIFALTLSLINTYLLMDISQRQTGRTGQAEQAEQTAQADQTPSSNAHVLATGSIDKPSTPSRKKRPISTTAQLSKKPLYQEHLSADDYTAWKNTKKAEWSERDKQIQEIISDKQREHKRRLSQASPEERLELRLDQVNFYYSKLLEEPRDPEWADEMESSVESFITDLNAEYDVSPVNVETLECRKSFCYMEVSGDDSEKMHETLEPLNEEFLGQSFKISLPMDENSRMIIFSREQGRLPDITEFFATLDFNSP